MRPWIALFVCAVNAGAQAPTSSCRPISETSQAFIAHVDSNASGPGARPIAVAYWLAGDGPSRVEVHPWGCDALYAPLKGAYLIEVQKHPGAPEYLDCWKMARFENASSDLRILGQLRQGYSVLQGSISIDRARQDGRPGQAPADGAVVSIENGRDGLRTIASPEGEFEFTGLRPGAYRMQIEKAGFVPYGRLPIAVLIPEKHCVSFRAGMAAYSTERHMMDALFALYSKALGPLLGLNSK